MQTHRDRAHRVIAIAPHSKGFGFAVFEHIAAPIDWGERRVMKMKNAQSLIKVEQLVDTYKPGILLIEQPDGSRRSLRIKQLIRQIVTRAKSRGIAVTQLSKATIHAFFMHAGAKTKYDIAVLLARRIPALRPRLPKRRKPWQSEDDRISIFEAVAMCWVCFAHLRGQSGRSFEVL